MSDSIFNDNSQAGPGYDREKIQDRYTLHRRINVQSTRNFDAKCAKNIQC